jgi:hypothetical protein
MEPEDLEDRLWRHEAMLVGVRVGFTEVELRDRGKQAGGKWNRHRKGWERRDDRVVALKLEARIVEEASHTRYQG